MKTPIAPAFGFVLITVLIDMIGFGIIIPVLPALVEEVGQLGLEEAALIAGWMYFVYSMAQFLFAPIMGNLSDRFGRRPMLLLAIFGLGMDYLLSAVAPTLFWLFVGRLLAGICGSSWVIANAYIADVTTPANRAKAYGLMGAAFGTGFVIGPAIGGLLGELGPRVPFWVAAAISFANCLYGWFVLPETLPKRKRRRFEWKRANPFGAFRVFTTYPGVIPICAVLVTFYFGSAVYPAIWPFWGMAKFGWTEATIGLTLAIFGLILAGFQGGLTGISVRRLGEHRVAMIGLICGVIAAACYGFTGTMWGVVLLMFVHGPEGFVQPMLMARMTRMVPDNAQGELQGGIAALTNLAMLAGTVTFTQLFSYFMSPAAPIRTPDAAFFLSSAVLALALVIYLIAVKDPARERR